MNVTISDLKFGFEYETLVNAMNVYHMPYISCLKKTKTQLANGDQCKDIDNKVSATVNRFIIGSYINSKQTQVKCKVVKAYHVEKDQQVSCLPAEIFDMKQVKDMSMEIDTSVWVISYDGSVIYKQKNGVNASAIPHFPRNPFPYDVLDNVIKIDDKSNIIECMEFVSPIINHNYFFGGFLKDLNSNGNFQCFHNKNTSAHVHVSHGDTFRKPQNLIKAAMAWWYFEPFFLLIVPWWRRYNEYCMPLHETVMSVLTKDWFKKEGNINTQRSVLINIFTTCTEENYSQMLADIGLTKVTVPGNLQVDNDVLDIIRILTFFQGGTGTFQRYGAFNMLNTLGKTGTIEVRIKHGSTDADENSMFIKLIGFFFVAILINACVSTLGYNDNAWKMKEYLGIQTPAPSAVPSPLEKFKTQTSIEYQGNEIVNQFMSNFFSFLTQGCKTQEDYNECIKVINYWNERLTKLHCSCALGIGGSNIKYLFSYGSNSSQQLKRRIKRKKDILCKPAYLPDHVRIFAGNSKKWDGGVASIHPRKKNNVYGTLFEVTEAEIQMLDKFEKGYIRTTKNVIIQESGNPEVQAYVYVKNDTQFEKLPSKEYMQAISKQLSETNRKAHKSKIIIRTINKKSNKPVAMGYWEPKEGFVLTRY